MGREGEACKGRLRLGKGRNDRGQGGEPPPHFPPTPPSRLA